MQIPILIRKKIFYILFNILFLVFSTEVFSSTNSSINNQIDPHKVKYISYMMAAPSGSGQSAFGHSYLLFKADKFVSPNDKTIEFVAAVNPSDINYLRGLGVFAYDRQVAAEKLEIIKKSITIEQNRDLEIYDLKLSDLQRNKIVGLINKILVEGKMGEYSFLSSNCAEAVSELLMEIGIEVSGFSATVPTLLRDKLKDNGLISNTTIFLSVENARLNSVKRYASVLAAIPLPKYFRNLEEMFKTDSEAQQLFALLMVKQNRDNSPNHADIDAFVNSYWLTLSAVMKKQFNQISAVGLGSVRLSPKVSGHSFDSYKVRSTKIECTSSECFLNIIFSRNDEKKDFIASKLPLRVLTVKGDEIYFGDLFVGVRLGGNNSLSPDSTILFAATPVVSKYFSDGDYFADIGLIVEKNLSSSFQKKNISWDAEVISQTNIDPQYPMCFTLLLLQKAMFQQAIFAPSLPKLDNSKNLQILNGLLNGQIAVIPGYENAYDFTKTISHVDFINEIYPYHKNNFNGLINGMGQWLKMEKLDEESLKAMAVLTHNLNISVPVIFRKNNDNSQITSHAVLITDMRDEGDFYNLSGYDPNYTHTIDFGIIDKKTLLMKTKTYGSVDLYIEKQNLDKEILDMQISHSENTRDLLTKQAAKVGTYLFSTYQVLRIQ